MGSTNFDARIRVPKKTSDEEAFLQARQNAQFEHGHGGYTGSLAEKSDSLTIHRAKNEANAQRLMSAIMDHWHGAPSVYREELTSLVNDKFGSAGAIRYPIDKDTDGLIFFGSASC